MQILSIETSCDETAISILKAKSNGSTSQFKILSNITVSQIELHRKYGGVFPALAKREHSCNLIPILEKALKEADLLKLNKKSGVTKNSLSDKEKEISKILEREPVLLKDFLKLIPDITIPKIDVIAVTYGPGLEPALWVGLNFAKALSLVWDKPLVPVNHMEGHIVAALFQKESTKEIGKIEKIKFPALSLLLSGGHTELVLMKDWMRYKTIGQTRDDAVGEAFDKVARMIGLPYPGGPEISRLADKERAIKKPQANPFLFPRPMINNPDFDFSFSGLKTSVLYTIKKLPKLTPKIKQQIALAFEEAVVDVLTKKTKKAIKEYEIKTLILGGGVTANKEIRKTFQKLSKELGIDFFIPEIDYSTDNALMIGIAGYFRYLNKKYPKTRSLRVNGNLKLK
jgi:N6-L-threonylcarbamoyladenine synthase